MKRFKYFFVLALCAVLSLSTLVGCSKDYTVTDVKYSIGEVTSVGFYVNYEFTVNGLPEEDIFIKYNLYLKDKNGEELDYDSLSCSFTVEEGESTYTVKKQTYFYKKDVPNVFEIKSVEIKLNKVQVSLSKEDRLKPVAITFGVFSCLGAVAIVAAFAISKKKERKNPATIKD